MQDRLIYDAIEGPLTEDEYSDIEVDGDSDSDNEGDSEPIGSPLALGKRQKQVKDRYAEYRRKKRAKKQTEGGTHIKEVSRKRGAQGAQGALPVNYDVQLDACVTAPGWVGMPARNLPPREVFTRKMLEGEYGMKCFNWDGM